MTEVFISYSRQDLRFAKELAGALEARDKQPWMDVRGIEDGEVFPQVLRRAIEASDGFVFIISPAAASSSFCQQELDHALALGKRIVPVLHREVPDEALPAGIRERQWVQAGDEVTGKVAERVARALDAEPDHTREHTRLLLRARHWDARGRRSTDLPRGEELADAEAWLTNAQGRDPAPTVLHAEWIGGGRAAVGRRQRRLVVGAAGIALVTVALLIFALVSRHQAVRAESAARSQAIAAEAESQLERDPQRALLLARRALQLAPTPDAQLAVSDALDTNTVRSELPSFGVQGCVVANYMYLLDAGRVAVDNTCDGFVVFGDVSRRHITRRIRVGPSTTDMTLAPDGRSLLVATGRDLVSVDVASGQVRRIFTAPFPIDWIAHGTVGRWLVIGDTDTVGRIDFRHHRLAVIAHGDASVNLIVGMLWTSRNNLLIETGGQIRGRGDLPAGVMVLDTKHGTVHRVPLASPPHQAELSFLNISPDRRTLFITGSEIDTAAHNQVATTWAIDPASRRIRWTARGPASESANSVNPSPDGTLLGVGYSQGAIDVLDARTGRRVVRDRGSASISAGWMAFPPGDRSMVTVSLDGVFRTWASRGTEQLRLQAPADSVLGFTPDGRDLVIVGQRAETVDRLSGQSINRFPGFPAVSVSDFCNFACVAASPTLHRLTYVDPAAATPRIVELDGETGRRVAAVSVARLDAQGVAPDGRIAVAYVDGARLYAQIVDPRSGAIRTLQPGTSSNGCAATTPSFTLDGRLMAVLDGCIHVVVWNLQTGQVMRTSVLPDRANASSAAGGGTTASGAYLSPDGRYVLATLEGGGLVRIDLSTGSFAERPGMQSVADTLAVSPDGSFYAIGHQDGSVDEYDGRSLRVVRHHYLEHSIQSLVFSPDGRELAVKDSSGAVWVWDTCAICQNPRLLASRAAQQSVRPLTPSERQTFNLG